MFYPRGGRRPAATIALLLLLALLPAGCKPKHPADAMAIVNGRVITGTEVDRACAAELSGSSQVSPTQRDTCRSSALDRLIDEQILQQQAEKLHIAANDDDIDSKIIDIKTSYTAEEFAEHLKAQGMTLDDLRKEVGRIQSQERLFNKEINSRINVTEADIAAYYRTHASEFNLPERGFHVASIVVNSSPDPARARRKIDRLFDVLSSGEDFATIAGQYSEDPPSAAKGGDMGLIAESGLARRQELYSAILQLHPGQFTGVIPVRDDPASTAPTSYVIARLLDVETAGQHQLDDPRVQQAIHLSLLQARSQLLRAAYLEILRNQAHIENYFADSFFPDEAKPR